MTKEHWFLLLGALLLAVSQCGCLPWADAPHTPVSPLVLPLRVEWDPYSDPKPCHLLAIASGIDRWNAAADDRYGLQVLQEGTGLFRSYGTVLVRVREIDGPLRGTAESINGPLDLRTSAVVTLEPDCVDVEWIAAHELGHALGRSHSSDELSVMYPYIPEGPVDWQIQPADLDYLLP